MRPGLNEWLTGLLIAALLVAAVPAAGMAAPLNGKVHAVNGSEIVIRLDKPAAPPHGSKALVFSAKTQTEAICHGLVTGGSGLLITTQMKKCDQAVQPGYPARIYLAAQTETSQTSTPDKCKGLSGFLECHLRYTLYGDDGRVQVRSAGRIPFTTTDQSPDPIRGRGFIRNLTSGKGRVSSHYGPSETAFEVRGTCQGDTVTFTVTSASTNTGQWVGSNPAGEVRGAPSQRGAGGSQTVTLRLVNGATANVPILQGGGGGQATYILHLKRR